MIKSAVNDYKINEIFKHRWSAYRFVDKPVVRDYLNSLFEAACWVPSSYTEQPWRFVLATKLFNEAFNKMISVLFEGNRAWAQQAL